MRTFTPETATRHKVQTIRTLAFLAAWGAGQREVSSTVATARLRAHERIRRLSEEVLADPGFARADTEPIPTQPGRV